MPIAPGDRLPALTVTTVAGGETAPRDLAELLGSGTAVLFSVPGAFTPTCSAKHLPGFVEKHAALREKGVNTVACLAVNDAFVMKAWGREAGANDIVMIADGSGRYTEALGLPLDMSARDMGVRGQRFALIARDGVVEHLFVEKGGDFSVSSADHVLKHL